VLIVVVGMRNMLLAGPLGDYPMIDNPVGIAALDGIRPAVELVNGPGVVVAAALAIASSVMRYRRGSEVERAQLRWFGASAALTITFLGITVFGGPISNVGWIGLILSFSLIPIAIGIAILRYRLYDIDRIVSRTIAYALITGLVVLTYVVVNLLLTTLLGAFVTGNAAVVAASTLVVAAVFTSLRRRVQRVVDRRFDRSRFDADRTTAAFSGRLRDEVDISTLLADLDETVRSALVPESLALWLRPAEPRANS